MPEESNAALESALNAGQVGFWELDLVRNTSRRSLRHDQCFGYQTPIAEADWGLDIFLRHVHPEDRAQVDAGLRDAISQRTAWNSEFRVVWPDGSVHWLAANGNTYPDAERAASRMLGLVMDITDRRLAEERLRTSESQARSQVAALTRKIDALAMDSATDGLAEHVLRTITEQFDAQSCSVWRRDEETGLFDLQSTLEDGKFITRADPSLRGVSLRISLDEFWRDALKAGQPVIMEDIRILRDSAWRARLLALGVVTVVMVPMSISGRVHGTIGIRFTRRRVFSPIEVQLVKALANQTMLTLQLTYLAAQARESAVIAERNRLARDIHDTLAQGFTGVIVQLEAASDADSRGLVAESKLHVSRARDLARESLTEARRSVQALRPAELEDKELTEALEALVRGGTIGTPVEAEFTLEGTPRALPSTWDENLLRVTQEVLTNVLRHSRATKIRVFLKFGYDDLHLLLADDGQGFDPLRKHDGFGLLGMRERVESMGGQLTIESMADAGTTISIMLSLSNATESLPA